MKEKILLGLSGGVDSSVAAILLKKQGYEVIGAFMKNFSDNKNPLTGECNWVEEREMAKKIASILEIQFITIDFEKEYKKFVINPMYEDYKKGLTPNPDVACNTIIKFPLFYKEAKKRNIRYIAMGHYARIKKTKTKFLLLKGKDKNKDQSYFLYELTQKDLKHTLLPIGNLSKEKVRQIAKENNLPNWNKKGTRGICFVGKVNMKSFLEKKIKNKEGIVKDPLGNIIGKHPGNFYYTLGQRIGPHINIEINKEYNQNKRWYIAKKLKNNIIIAAPENHPMLKNELVKLTKVNLINKTEKIPTNLKARIRHLGPLHSGNLIKRGNSFFFKFNKRIEQLAPGQSLVFYSGDNLIGGGQIRLK